MTVLPIGPEFIRQRVGVGYILRFGDSYFATTTTLDDFGSVTTEPLTIAVPSQTVHDGIMTLAGGRIYSPWSLAFKRAPVSYPRYSQSIMVKGQTDACLKWYSDFLELAGRSGNLYFSYGRVDYDATAPNDYDDWNQKYCRAMLLSVTATMERDSRTRQVTARNTHFIVQAVWQQVGDFERT